MSNLDLGRMNGSCLAEANIGIEYVDLNTLAEMVTEVSRLHWERRRVDDPSLGTWNDYIALCNTRAGRELWLENLRHLQAGHFEGESEELVRKVAEIIDAIVTPPKRPEGSAVIQNPPAALQTGN